MAELLPQERLQPSLLDRLSDDHPGLDDARSKVVLSLAQLRASVLRDLRWLLNTIALEATHDLSDYPEVVSSTLNYGIPNLAGTSSAGINAFVLQRAVRRAIVNFEPRILASSVNVEVRIAPDQMDRQALVLTIEGQLWARPHPVNLYLRTELDLETGTVIVDEAAR